MMMRMMTMTKSRKINVERSNVGIVRMVEQRCTRNSNNSSSTTTTTTTSSNSNNNNSGRSSVVLNTTSNIAFFCFLLCLLCLGRWAAANPVDKDLGRGGSRTPAGSSDSSPAWSRSGRSVDDTPIETVGRCRVRCLTQITNTESSHLKDCWNMCERLYTKTPLFRPLCDGDYCKKGCQIACFFWNKTLSVPPPDSNVLWEFPGEVTTQMNAVTIYMSWPRPLPNTTVPLPHPIVYVLLMRQNNDAWKLIGQTYEEEFRIPVDDTYLVPEFAIQAIDETGNIASRVFHVREMIFRETVDHVDADALGEVPKDVNKVDLTHSLTYDPLTGMSAHLTWTNPGDLMRPGVEDLKYEVVYILKWCGIYIGLPECSYAEDLYNSVVPMGPGRQTHYTIIQLYFNSRYEVQLRTVGGRQLASVLLDTYACEQPTADFLFCLNGASPSVFDQRINGSSSSGSGSNVTGVFSSQSGGGGGGGNGSWGSEAVLAEKMTSGTPFASVTELIQDLLIEVLPEDDDGATVGGSRGGGGGVPGGGRKGEGVLVNVSWTFLSDPNVVNFSLTIVHRDTQRVDVYEVMSGATTSRIFRLLDNAVYELVLEVKVSPEVVRGLDIVYAGRGSDYLEDSRQTQVFNTSLLQLAARERLHAGPVTQKSGKESHVIIIMICVGVTLALALLAAFLYMKRHRVKDLIAPRATVSKSNSYKSSVGGKTDYSNQLMVFSDEWELDPGQLKFCTPIGQGAFGRVVNGYYTDNKVAIKVVKEGAPMSYKEDLVAEINLMKRLGSHPNIVCLVGACTVREPIALVMEFVPYGNLQNFLKRCRLEGDLQKRPNGPSEIQYSMLQGCGGIDNGVITPTDMLSFARQVAMAMEYLAEKKYVHRDLAARNVLLHYHKVVKVCDFGLSRDIFHDNQYTKLTSGKLPLKWMAIESLRDRVFTTQSDVWSFGILLWEIVTMGASPYPSIALADLYYVLSNHYRMDKTTNCSDELYAVMRACWEERPEHRPSFTQLRERLEDLMAEERDYLMLEDIDVPLSASDSSSNPTPTTSDLFSEEMGASHSARQLVGGVSSGGSLESSGSASAMMPASASASASASAGAVVAASSSASASTALLRSTLSQQPPPPHVRRLPMTIDVCIHQKSTEHLMRPGESDSSP